jgi:hypothetical protein
VPQALKVVTVVVVVEKAHLRHCCSSVDLSTPVTNNLISQTNFRSTFLDAKVWPFDEQNSTRTIPMIKT